MQTCIYTLSEPDGPVRYVGKTVATPARRLQKHLTEARMGRIFSPRVNWLRSLSDRGLVPELKTIQYVNDGQWEFWEIYWIQWHKNMGYRLVNSTNGGEGMFGWKHWYSTKEKIRRSNTGKIQSPETLAKKVASMTGKKRSLETRLRQSVSATGKIFSAEHRKNMSLAWETRRARGVSDATREKMRQARKSYCYGPI